MIEKIQELKEGSVISESSHYEGSASHKMS